MEHEPGSFEGWRPGIHGVRQPIDDAGLSELDSEVEPSTPSPAGTLDVGPAGVWYSTRVDPDWVAAYRLVPEGGSPVVAEIRVFPFERGHGFGRWSGQAWPQGGLPARVFRRVGVVTPLSRLTKSDRQKLLETWPAAGLKLGIDPKLVRRLRPARTVTAEFLAVAAQAYVDAYAENPRSPYPGAAQRLGYSKTYVKDLVGRARRDGYLTETSRGRAGGVLTNKALEALDAVAKSRRIK